MFLIVEKDLIVATQTEAGSGVVELPVALAKKPHSHLRFDGEAIVDVVDFTDWLIDESGQKRLPAMHGDKDWQEINCAFDDALILDVGVWRVETGADQLAKAKDEAIAGAVQAANSFTASVLDKYPEAERAGWPLKQAECEIIIAADDASTSIATALSKTTLMATIANAAGWDNAATVVAARAIIAKANEFAAIAAMVEVMRNTAETAVNAAVDLDALDAVKASLTEQAQALAEQYGLA